MNYGALLAVIALFATPCSAEDGLPNFEFRDAAAGVEFKPRQFGLCVKRNQPGLRSCTEENTTVAGKYVELLILETYEGRLSWISGNFKSVYFDGLAEAFTAKYGQPCEQQESEWTSVGGITVPNIELTWCFQTGKLTMRRTDDRLGMGGFDYLDDWQPPKPAPELDF